MDFAFDWGVGVLSPCLTLCPPGPHLPPGELSPHTPCQTGSQGGPTPLGVQGPTPCPGWAATRVPPMGSGVTNFRLAW